MNDLLKLNKVELEKKALECKKKMAQMRFDIASGKLVDTSAPKKMKKELARILTCYNQLKA
jgi:ribosomal protein L29